METNALQPETPAQPAPLPSMEQWRDLTFRDRVLARLRRATELGGGAEQVAREMAQEQQALAQALTRPEVIEAGAEAYRAAREPLSSEGRIALSAEDARATMEQILHRRAAECRNYVAQLGEETFWTDLIGKVADPQFRYVSASIRDVKMKETVEELLSVDSSGAPQVLAHMDAYRDGTLLTHQALGKAYATDGNMAKALDTALTEALPDTDRRTALLHEWLGDRAQAANTTVELIGNDGPAYQQAAAQSKQYHREKLGLAAPAESFTAGVKASRAQASAAVMDI